MRKLSGKRKPSWLAAGLVSGTTLVVTAIPNIALASGFSLSEQSARTLGQAFSGRASDADSATTLADNPAGMSRLTRPEFSGGVALVDAHADISHNSGSTSTPFGSAPINGSNDGDMIPLTAIPFGFYVHPVDDRLALGFGIYAPFGLTTDYESDFQGRYFGTKSAIQVITAQPTLSYKLNNDWSVGFGITYNQFDGELEKDIFNPIPGSRDINGGVKGDDWAWGYNIGLLYELDEDTRFGLTYYSKVDYTLEGHTTLEHVPVGPGLFPTPSVRYDASLDITTPERVDFSFTHGLTPQLTLHGDIAQTNWSRLQEIRVENSNAPAAVATTVEPLDWDRTMFYSLGLSYKIDPQWTVRGGIAFDEQPIPDSTRSVRLPAGDRKMAAIGATWAASDDISIDFSYLYIKEKEVRVAEEAGTLGVAGTYSYNAKFDSQVNLVAAQLNWKF
jgi:long-chain fatty acid transport protein